MEVALGSMIPYGLNWRISSANLIPWDFLNTKDRTLPTPKNIRKAYAAKLVTTFIVSTSVLFYPYLELSSPPVIIALIYILYFFVSV